MKLTHLGLLPRIVIAILLGIVGGLIMPEWMMRLFATFNALFGNLLGFFIPLLIVGLIVPGIAEVGRGAGWLLFVTVVVAYLFTLFSGFVTWGICDLSYQWILGNTALDVGRAQETSLVPYFTIDMPPIMGVTSALVAAFIIGVSLTVIKGDTLRRGFDDFREVVTLTIERVIIPMLPLYIFGIFMSMTVGGQVTSVLGVFVKLIVLIFAMTLLILIVQFGIAGFVARRNPFKLLCNMLDAYVTALGTQSSAATIPVTIAATIRNGVTPSVANFVVPLCATIHLSGSTIKITSCALAIIVITGMEVEPLTMVSFICMLGVTMVAAPGVPGGAIMAALGVLHDILGFNDTAIGLMIALYIAMDSFGTATNVTGDGAIAILIDKIDQRRKSGN
ncbi:MAG: dicarboxylate/amino acid:cation symporter [Alistipes sp.]|nr:dicarboxylate/amino acid:cation symporter [Alistipes sp.]